MEARTTLPLSPPTTDSAKSSPTFPSPASPALTPPKSPDVQRATHSSSPPTAGSSPLPPLPAEVFLLILQSIPPPQRYLLRLVSRSWSTFLVSEPQLWPTLDVHLHGGQNLEHWVDVWTNYASVNAGAKSNGGIRSLCLRLAAGNDGRGHRFADWIPTNVVTNRMQEVVRMVAGASVPHAVVDQHGRRGKTKPSTLTSLQVVSRPNTVTSLFILYHLAQSSRDAVFESVTHIDLNVNVPALPLESTFFSMWPLAVSMKLKFPHRHTKGLASVPCGNWSWIPPGSQQSRFNILPDLQQLSLEGASISRGLFLPYMPSLTQLSLHGVEWEGKSIFRLLRYVRKTLVELVAIDLELQEDVSPEVELEEWNRHVDIREPLLTDNFAFPDDDSIVSEDRFDEPAPIILSALRYLQLSGNSTPPFFASMEYVENYTGEPSVYPTPVLVMPALETVVLDDVITEQDYVLEESYGALATLGRNAPNVVSFDLLSSVASDDSIFHCLAAMSAKMRRMSFYNSDMTDQLICKLVDLVPQLEELDVRSCQQISIQTVARLVEKLRGTYGPRIKIVRVDPPDQYSTRWDYEAYRWLDFVDVLVRDSDDFEGDGPDPAEDWSRRVKWKVMGKASLETLYRHQWEKQVEQEREAAAQLAAIQFANGLTGAEGEAAGGSGSSSRFTATPAGVWPSYVHHQQQQPHHGHFLQFPQPPIARPSSAPPSQPIHQQQSQPTLDPRLALVSGLRTTPVAQMDTN
ncbi:hypothetical protein BCR35DRAFT_307184 [Leucosporidium creatinivorum]|uniref:F-box domain-containing protein n=1 Tax=Leucosporidium creatinivorum TaxID=106004 RepID=A0A1Y2ERG8_9BASI|nr:hypothetical protein BCR35DRAFT_307184 [Leucosporidium creatinivorum]